MAAEQGSACGQVSLAYLYDTGRGVPQNDAEAVKWYRMDADQGNASAQFNLGNMYCNGRGIPQDYVQAHMWFNLAAARFSGNDKDYREKAVAARDRVAAKMTPQQIAEAQALAINWKPKGE